jgi:carboxylesterase
MIGLVTGLRLLGTATMKTAMDNSMKKVILFIHGFAGHPNQFKLFYPEIPDGYDYRALLLAGHGGSVDDFGRASMKEWQNQVDESMVELSEKYDEIYVVAHSMGTLFAMQRARVHNVKALFLLAVPLYIRVSLLPFLGKLRMIIRASRDSVHSTYDPCSGVEADMRFWKYLKWIPNYVSLSKESRKTRALVESKPWTGKKCVIFQSAHDELVSSKSEKLLTGLGCDVDILENSSHHQYSQTDGEKLVQAFHAWLK